MIVLVFVISFCAVGGYEAAVTARRFSWVKFGECD